MEKCAEMGVDPEVVAKIAQAAPDLTKAQLELQPQDPMDLGIYAKQTGQNMLPLAAVQGAHTSALGMAVPGALGGLAVGHPVSGLLFKKTRKKAVENLLRDWQDIVTAGGKYSAEMAAQGLEGGLKGIPKAFKTHGFDAPGIITDAMFGAAKNLKGTPTSEALKSLTKRHLKGAGKAGLTLGAIGALGRMMYNTARYGTGKVLTPNPNAAPADQNKTASAEYGIDPAAELEKEALVGTRERAPYGALEQLPKKWEGMPKWLADFLESTRMTQLPSGKSGINLDMFKMSSDDAYVQGVMEKCAELGLDMNDEMVKEAIFGALGRGLGALGRSVKSIGARGMSRLGKRMTTMGTGDPTTSFRSWLGHQMVGKGDEIAQAVRQRGLAASGIGQGSKATTTLTQTPGSIRGKLPGRSAAAEFTEQSAKNLNPFISDKMMGGLALGGAGLGGYAAMDALSGQPEQQGFPGQMMNQYGQPFNPMAADFNQQMTFNPYQ